MKSIILVLVILAITFSLNCKKEDPISSNNNSGIEGHVYATGAPAVTADWTPPPLDAVTTIIVLDTNRTEITQATTDNHGRFNIPLPSGVYFLQVKESPLPTTTGPFNVTKDHVVSVEAHYDNGVR